MQVELDDLSEMELMLLKCSLDDNSGDNGLRTADAKSGENNDVKTHNSTDFSVLLSEPGDGSTVTDAELSEQLSVETQNPTDISFTAAGATQLPPAADSASVSSHIPVATVLQSADVMVSKTVESSVTPEVHKKSSKHKKSAKKEEASTSKQSMFISNLRLTQLTCQSIN